MAQRTKPRRNGTGAARPPAPEVGQARRLLEKPERVADLSVAEAQEIKERRRLVDKTLAEVSDLQMVVTLLRNEQMRFLQTLLISRGLTLDDDYNVDSDAGVIFRTAVFVKPEVEEVERVEEDVLPAAVSGDVV